MAVLLDTFVNGRPRTKGSLKPIINWSTQKYRMVEQVEQSKPWRLAISNHVIKTLACDRPVSPALWTELGLPYDRPVSVEMSFTFALNRVDVGPADADGWPVGIGWGDIDKLTRNVLDALTDAKLYRDDSLVVAISATKSFARDLRSAGVSLRVESMP